MQDEADDDSDSYLDDEMKAEDRSIRLQIDSILQDHKKEIQNYVAPSNRNDHRDKKMTRVQEKMVALSTGADIANIPSSAVSKCLVWFFAAVLCKNPKSNVLVLFY